LEKEKVLLQLITDEGEKEAEIISFINIENLGDYIIYRVDKDFYGAKYELDGDDANLITDLSDKEKEALNEVFERMEIIDA